MDNTRGIVRQTFVLKFITVLGIAALKTFLILTPLAVAGLFLLIHPAEVAAQQPGSAYYPPYLEQLEKYRNHTLQHFRLEEEKQARAARLEDSVQLHTIQRGETLGEIANIYGVELAALAYWNNITNPHRIREGEVLHVLTVEGTLHQVGEGDTLTAVASRYNVDRQKIFDFNMLETALLEEGNRLVIPGAKTLTGKVEKEPAVLTLASRGGAQAPVFRWPLLGTVTSYYGMRAGGFHFGLDIAAPYGTEVVSAASGIVEFTGVQRGYGLMLTVDHGNGWSSLYAHNSSLLVSKGQRVSAGTPVAKVGASGNATGPHLHLEIMQHGKKLDPMGYLP